MPCEWQLSMSGNSSGTIGSAHYKDGSGEFTISGDTEQKTGEVELSYGTNEIRSTTNSDSSSLSMNIGSLGMEGLSSSTRGKLKISDGSDLLSVDYNSQDEVGELIINKGNVEVSASGDKINKTGSLSAKIGSNELEGVLSTDSSLLSLKTGSIDFAVSGDRNGESGSLSYKQGSVETRLGFDKVEESGEIYVSDGSNSILVEGNKPVSYTHLTLPTTPYV